MFIISTTIQITSNSSLIYLRITTKKVQLRRAKTTTKAQNSAAKDTFDL